MRIAIAYGLVFGTVALLPAAVASHGHESGARAPHSRGYPAPSSTLFK